MKYKIWDKFSGQYLDLTKYYVNGFGKVMAVNGEVLNFQDQFEIEVEIDKN